MKLHSYSLLGAAVLLALLPASVITNRQIGNALPAGTCFLTVPVNPLSAQGLATPYQISGTPAQSGNPAGCTEPDGGTTIILQAAVLSPTGQAFAYDPLVVTAGTSPQVAPIVPKLARGDRVAIWVGSSTVNTQLIGPGASAFVTGLPGSNFGQVAYSASAIDFFAAATRDIKQGSLVVPKLGTTATGGVCPTVNAFSVGDQDPVDNTTATYLTNGTTVAQDTAANRAAFPNDTTLNTGSDNELLDAFMDPALDINGGTCTPWAIPSLDDPGATESTLAFDQLQSAADQSDQLTVELSDEMALAGDGPFGTGTSTVNGVTYVGVHESRIKADLYDLGVDLPVSANPSESVYCHGLDQVFPAFLVANETALENAPSPTGGQNLANFLAQRFVQATWDMPLPFVGAVPTCTQATGIADPVQITATNAMGDATAFTVTQ